jgi:hypothetical protein
VLCSLPGNGLSKAASWRRDPDQRLAQMLSLAADRALLQRGRRAEIRRKRVAA